MGHGGVRAGRRTTVREHSAAELKELELLWLVTRDARTVYRCGFICVCVTYAERKTERRLKALHGIDKTLRLMISHTHTRHYFTLCSHVKEDTP